MIPEKKNQYRAEQILPHKNIAIEGISDYLFGLSLWTAFDKVLFDTLPKMSVIEQLDKASLDKNGHEISSVRFDFTNLVDHTGEMTKIILYYETVLPDGPPLPKVIDLKWLQNHKRLAEIPVLELSSSLSFTQEITLPYPTTYYNFYACYIDAAGRVITLDGTPIINYAWHFPLYGYYISDGMVAAKNVSIVGLETVADLDNVGYAGVQDMNNDKLRLQWFDVTKVKDANAWSELFDGDTFYDTSGRTTDIDFNMVKKFDTYLVYRFTTSNGIRPNILYPIGINPTYSFKPTTQDVNGWWDFVAETTNPFMDVTIELDKIYSFWVGMRFKQ